MLGRQKEDEESMMHNFYSKNCGLIGTNAVSYIIDKLSAELKSNAKPGNYQTPDNLFYGLLSKMGCLSFHHKRKLKKDNNESELSLPQPKRCILCKKIGHKARQCMLKKSYVFRGSAKYQSAIECFICGKEGHLQQDCWAKTK